MNIAAVVVTFNRLEKLQITLQSFKDQIRPVDYLIVVNNGCTDGTADYLEQWKAECPEKNHVITNPSNLGGAGGFYTGMEYALKLDADWIWVSDDDAYPNKDAISNLENYCNTHNTVDIAALCAEVISYDEIAIGHRRRIQQKTFTLKEKSVPLKEYEQLEFDLDLYSYVGAVIKKEALLEAGLPRKEYFIQWDDSEHSIRIRKSGRIVCIPSVKVVHDIEYSPFAGYQWKDYYLIRNRMDAIRRNFPHRYYYSICIKRIYDLINVHLKPNKEWAQLFTAAVFDAWKGKLGIHQIYRPGWKPKSDRLGL